MLERAADICSQRTNLNFLDHPKKGNEMLEKCQSAHDDNQQFLCFYEELKRTLAYQYKVSQIKTENPYTENEGSETKEVDIS